MLRRALLYLSERQGLQDFLLERKFARRLAHRFVAGETLDDAIRAIRELNAHGMKVTLDHLGESVSDPDAARAAARDYVEILERVERESVDSGISIKLTQLGLAIDEELCRANVRRIAETARDHGNFVRVDMERAEFVEPTLRFFHELYPEFSNLGVVIQSYLRRSADDVEALCSRGASVRLCKGAYSAPEEVAFQSRSRIDESFLRLLERLVACGAPLAVATHHGRLIEAAKRLKRDRPGDDAPFEFQMLYGVRRELQTELVDEGYRMRIYVPFGTEWYPYFMRRMAERPANLLFVLRALLGG